MSQFTSAISDLRRNLGRQYDRVLMLKNVPPSTIDRDAHYAIFRLAEIVGKAFPSAEPMFPWVKESISYRLPGAWETDKSAYWLVECPRLRVSYDEGLAADDALVAAGAGEPFLFFTREVRIDSLLARVTLEATIPAKDAAVLRSIGKIVEETHEAYTTTHLVC